MANSNNTTATVLAVVVTLVVAGAGGYMLGNRMGQPEAKVVATVNGEKITQPELYARLVAGQGPTVLDRIITAKLVAQEAKKSNVAVTDAEVQKELAKVKESFGSEESFQQALAGNGISEDELKESILIQLQATKILGKDIKPTDEELKTYFDENLADFDKRQVTARHILVNTEDEAKAIKAELDAGADFATMAKEKSIEPAAKTSGGDLGTFGRGKMDKDFEKAVFSMQKGQISDPVRTQFGYHIIHLQDITGVAPDFAAMKAQVQEEYVSQKVAEQFTEWLANVRDKADINNTLEPKK